MKFKRTVSAVVLIACGACQMYTPISLAPTSTGTPVRVTLTDRGAAQLFDVLGAAPHEVEGKVVDVSDTTVTLGVTGVSRLSGADEPWNGERVTIPRGAIASVDRHSVSVVRSLLVAAGIVGGAYLATRAGSSGEQVGGPPQTPPPTQH